jgi:hypothetical protein
MRKLVLFSLFACLLLFTGCNSTKSIVLTINSPTGAQALDIGQTFNISVSVTNDKQTKGATFTLTGVGTLTNVSATGATYTATVAGNATVMVASATDPTKKTTINIVVTAAPGITTGPLAAATEGTAYSGTIAVTGGAGALTYSVTVASLPAGLNLNSSTGAITGTATGPGGTFTFTVQVKDSSTVAPQSNSKSFTITINLPPPPSITTTSPLPAGQVGAAYNKTIAVTGLSPFTFSVTSGSLPAGLGLNPSTGAITGTPTAYGTSIFTVKVVDSSNPTQSTSQPFSLTIAPAPVVITTTSLPNVVANTAYSASLLATGGATPITWSVIAGALPAGVNLAANGTFSGTPTTAGTAGFTVQAADSSSPVLTATKVLSITVIPVLSITTASPLPNGVAGTSYTATLASTGGSGAVTWSVTVGSLPAGLNLNGNTGAITGTPTTAGTYGFTVQAADSGTPQQKVTKAFAITINPQLIITTTALPTGAVTSNYSTTLLSSGGVPGITWAITAGALPGGLNLNAATGAITGTPTANGNFQFTAQATDSGTPQQVVTKSLNITINPALSISTTSPMASGFLGTAYNQSVLTNGGGIPPLTWSITAGALPTGLTIGPSTGAITGTPTATGAFSFTVQAADSGTPQQIATKALSISIATAPLSVATTSLPNGVEGQAYSTTLTSAGGNPPVTWSISSGSLPSWATLTASTGAITGTPNATGTTSFTVKATDSTVPTAQTATKALSITVNTALTITSTTLPGGSTGTAYSATLTATGGVTPYTWAVISGSLPSWANLIAGTGAITGTPDAGGTSSFTVQVTDTSSPQQTATQALSITVTVPTLTVTTTNGNLPAGTVNSAYPNTSLAASGGIPPYSWIVTGGALPPGLSLSPGGEITGTPTSATGSPFSFTVQVSDSASPTHNTATATLSITVSTSTCGSGSESLLSAGYAFVLKGFDSSGNPALVGGVLTFNGTDGDGLITAGAIDMNLNSGVQSDLNVTSGTYSIGSDQRGCMSITTSAGTNTYRISVGNITSGVASTVHVIDFDTTGPFVTGTMRKQTGGPFTASQFTGNYAFGASSIQNAANCYNGVCGGKSGDVGVIDFNGSGGITGGSMDINQNGVLDRTPTLTDWPATSPITFDSTRSSYSVSSNGRGTLTIAIVGISGTINSVLYAVSSSDALFMSSDPQTTNSVVAGEALLQSGTPFSANPLSGTYIGYDSGLGNSGTGRSDIILLGPLTSGSSTLTGTQLRNDGGTFKSGTAGGTYSVSSTGRMIITVSGSHHQPVLYLVNSTEAFFVAGNGSVDAGFFQSQSGSPFLNSSASGTYAYGEIDPEYANTSVQSGVASFASPNNVTVTEDDNSSSSQTVGGTQAQTYSVDSTGLGMIPSGCSISVTPTTCQTLFYIISPTKAVVMDTTSNNPKLQLADK